MSRSLKLLDPTRRCTSLTDVTLQRNAGLDFVWATHSPSGLVSINRKCSCDRRQRDPKLPEVARTPKGHTKSSQTQRQRIVYQPSPCGNNLEWVACPRPFSHDNPT